VYTYQLRSGVDWNSSPPRQVTAADFIREFQAFCTLGEDYIRTARAKGLAERHVVLRHAMRSALTPVVSQLGIDVGTLLGGVMVVETVFGIGGIGQDSVEAIDQGNLPLIIGFVLAAAVFVIVANILVDIAYTLLDPRVRLS